MSNYLVSTVTTFQRRLKEDKSEDDCAWGETWKLYRRNVWWEVVTKKWKLQTNKAKVFD